MTNSDQQPFERWVFFFVALLFMTAFWLGNDYYRVPFTKDVFIQTIKTFSQITLHWAVVRTLVLSFRRVYPSNSKFILRILLTFITSALCGVAISITANYIDHWVLSGRLHIPMHDLANHVGPPTFFSILVISPYEILHQLFNVRRMEKEKDALARAHLRSQLDSLKSQVNPHFLFNSLNTLASLISIDPARAEKFTEELAAVYRYVLLSNQKWLIPLREEMDFLNSYFHLLKTRYADALHIRIQINPELLEHQIPPLTLQLLVENVLKHNTVIASNPVHIDIHTRYGKGPNESPWLVIRNNLQKKMTTGSNQLGLTNIAAKYELLQQSPIVISDDQGHFTVELPLLKSTNL